MLHISNKKRQAYFTGMHKYTTKKRMDSPAGSDLTSYRGEQGELKRWRIKHVTRQNKTGKKVDTIPHEIERLQILRGTCINTLSNVWWSARIFFPRTAARVCPDFPNVVRVFSLCIDECVRAVDCSVALQHLCSELLDFFYAFSVGSLVLLCCISPDAFDFLLAIPAIARTLSVEWPSLEKIPTAQFEFDRAIAMRSTWKGANTTLPRTPFEILHERKKL